MKIKNTSNKIIGIGEVSVLPDSVVTVPEAFENSAVLEVYRKLGFIQIIEKARKKTAAEEAAEKVVKAEKAKADAAAKTAAKQARIAAVDSMNEEELAAVAIEMGVNPAECKDVADIRKKVKAALKK